MNCFPFWKQLARSSCTVYRFLQTATTGYSALPCDRHSGATISADSRINQPHTLDSANGLIRDSRHAARFPNLKPGRARNLAEQVCWQGHLTPTALTKQRSPCRLSNDRHGPESSAIRISMLIPKSRFVPSYYSMPLLGSLLLRSPALSGGFRNAGAALW